MKIILRSGINLNISSQSFLNCPPYIPSHYIMLHHTTLIPPILLILPVATPTATARQLPTLSSPAFLASFPRQLSSPARLASCPRQLASLARLAHSPKCLAGSASDSKSRRLAVSRLACSSGSFTRRLAVSRQDNLPISVSISVCFAIKVSSFRRLPADERETPVAPMLRCGCCI